MRALRPQLIMKAAVMPTRKAWLMIGGGVLGVVLGTGLSMTVGGWFYLATIAAAVIFFLGVNGLAGRGVWLMAPAFVVGVIGPTVLAVLGHQAALRQFGHEETCDVLAVHERVDVKRPYVDHQLGCPSGAVEIRTPYSERLPEGLPVRLLVGEPLKPLIANQVRNHGVLIFAIPGAMLALVLVAAGVRKR